jgi:hypothetical protein
MNLAKAREIPTNGQMAKVMLFGNTPDTALYIEEQYTGILEENNAKDGYLEAAQVVRENREMVDMISSTNGGSWDGFLRSGTEVLNNELAKKAQKNLQETFADKPIKVQWQIAVSNDAKIVRGTDADAKTKNNIDTLFSNWALKNNIIIKEGALFAADSNANIIEGKKVDSNAFKTLLADPEKGFKAEVAKSKVEIDLVEVDYPEQKQAVMEKPEVNKQQEQENKPDQENEQDQERHLTNE